MCVSTNTNPNMCVCPKQDRRPIRLSLPTQLSKKWATHIGHEKPQKQYQYYVTTAVRQAKSTREHFFKCWNRYQRDAKNNGEKYFLDDVFQRFCDADFTKKKGDNSEGRLVFVLRILKENDLQSHTAFKETSRNPDVVTERSRASRAVKSSLTAKSYRASRKSRAASCKSSASAAPSR